MFARHFVENFVYMPMLCSLLRIHLAIVWFQRISIHVPPARMVFLVCTSPPLWKFQLTFILFSSGTPIPSNFQWPYMRWVGIFSGAAHMKVKKTGTGLSDGVRGFHSLDPFPRSIPGPGVIRGLSLLFVLVLAPRVFLRVLSGFSSLHKNQHFQIPSGISGQRATLWRCHCKFQFILFIYLFIYFSRERDQTAGNLILCHYMVIPFEYHAVQFCTFVNMQTY